MGIEISIFQFGRKPAQADLFVILPRVQIYFRETYLGLKKFATWEVEKSSKITSHKCPYNTLSCAHLVVLLGNNVTRPTGLSMARVQHKIRNRKFFKKFRNVHAWYAVKCTRHA